MSIIKQDESPSLYKEAIGMPKKHQNQEIPSYVIDALARAFLQVIERDHNTSTSINEKETATKAS